MRKDKWKKEEKRLCAKAEKHIGKHIEGCRICQKSFDSAKDFDIPTSPMCNTLMQELRQHVDSCGECSTGEKKWNDDAIPITTEMRLAVSQLQSGKMPDMGLMKTVASQLMKELDLTSDEIGKMQQAAQDKVKGFLKDRFGNEQV